MRSHWTFAVAVVLLVAGTDGVHAQGLEVEVTPLLGGQFALADLPGSFELTSESGLPTTFDGAEIDGGLTLGGRTGLRFGSGLGIGATVLYSPTQLTEGSGAETDLGMWLYGMDASYHALGPTSMARPFVVAGIGGKTYIVDGMDAETDLMWNVGGGIDVQVHPRAAFRLEARDYMSVFDPEVAGVDDEIQHDMAVTAGLRFVFEPGRRR